MATKLYEDATTKELVIEDANGSQTRYAPFCEMSRTINGDYTSIKYLPTDRIVLSATIFSELQDSGGSAYANAAAVKTALDGYFDATA